MQMVRENINVDFYSPASADQCPYPNLLERFDALLDSYFYKENPKVSGLPYVAYFAEKLQLSPNYFGDQIKKISGESPQTRIHNKIIKLAKHKINCTPLSISEIAYQLGFTYPQHFMRFFKQKVGDTPTEYRLNSKSIN